MIKWALDKLEAANVTENKYPIAVVPKLWVATQWWTVSGYWEIFFRWVAIQTASGTIALVIKRLQGMRHITRLYLKEVSCGPQPVGRKITYLTWGRGRNVRS